VTLPVPFIRCAGGKRSLVPLLLERCPPPDAYDVYAEPFLGGGALYFALVAAGRLEGKARLLSDVDADLIHLYTMVRQRPAALVREYDRRVANVQDLGTAEATYLRERALWNRRGRSAVRHYYLRRNSYNGLWRQNASGEMNAPWNRELPKPADRAKLMAASVALQDAELAHLDFSGIVVGKRTFVYLDPPYLGGFTSYVPTRWSEGQFTTLLQRARRWTDEGAHVLLSHADDEATRDLLASHWPEARVDGVHARRSISSDGTTRQSVPEVLAYVTRLDT
jgi:DNA adenine methylase